MAQKKRKNARIILESEQRIGVLTPDELEAIGFALFDGRGWQKTFVRGTGVAGSTLTRYLQGLYPIPQTVAVLLDALSTLKRHGLPFPDAFSDGGRVAVVAEKPPAGE